MIPEANHGEICSRCDTKIPAGRTDEYCSDFCSNQTSRIRISFESLKEQATAPKSVHVDDPFN